VRQRRSFAPMPLAGFFGAVEPVEFVGAEQDEVNHRGKPNKEYPAAPWRAKGRKVAKFSTWCNLLNDVGHEGVHRSFHALAHALGILRTGQQIAPVNAYQAWPVRRPQTDSQIR
jgi:hypothetical protein